MKKLIIYFLPLMGFSSCLPTAHIAIMPNEPAFENIGEIKTGGTIGTDHFEAQGALSFTKFSAITGGFYSGIKGVEIYEYGLNIFHRIPWTENFFLSATGGLGQGKYDGSYTYSSGPGGSLGIKVDTYYTTQYLQGSFIVKPDIDGNDKIIFSIKKEWIDFKKFNVEIDKLPRYGSSIYTIQTQTKDKKIFIVTPFIGYFGQPEHLPIYFELQCGLRINSTFNSEFRHKSANSSPSHFAENKLQPLMAPLMLNIALGYKLKL